MVVSCQEEAREIKAKRKEDEQEENQEGKIRNEVTRGIVAGALKETDTVGGGAIGNTVSALPKAYM